LSEEHTCQIDGIVGSSSEYILLLWEISSRSQSSFEDCLESLGSEPRELGGGQGSSDHLRETHYILARLLGQHCTLTLPGTGAPLFWALRRPPSSAQIGFPMTILIIQLIRFSAFCNPFLAVCHWVHLVPLILESGQGGTPKLKRLSGHFYMKLLHKMVLLSHWLSNCVRALCVPRDTLGGWRTGD